MENFEFDVLEDDDELHVLESRNLVEFRAKYILCGTNSPEYLYRKHLVSAPRQKTFAYIKATNARIDILRTVS